MRLQTLDDPSDGTPVTNKVWYLQQNRLFSDAAAGDVEAYQHLFRMQVYPKRTHVFDVGDPARIVYLVKYGKVRIARLTADGKEVTLTVLGAGDIFGEQTLFDAERPRSTVAVCVEETLLCLSRADELFGLLASDPHVAINVAKILSGRLDGASETIEDVSYAKVADRILHLFERLAREHGRPTIEGIAVDVTLTHGEIASAVGSTRETVSLELSNLLKSGRLVQRDRSYIVPS